MAPRHTYGLPPRRSKGAGSLLRLSACAVLICATSLSAQTSNQAQTLSTRDVTPPLSLSHAPINCTIKPLRVVEVSSPVAGIAADVFVKPGQQISQGDPIVRLDDKIIRAELALAEARAANTSGLAAARIRRDGLAKREARLAKAVVRNAVSANDYDTAQLDLALAEAQIHSEENTLKLAQLDANRLRATIDAMTLRSPVDGVVGEDLIDPGESAGSEHVATLYVNQPLRVEAFVPTARLAAFVAQSEFEIRVNTGTEKHFNVTFDYAAQLADLASNTISVFFRLPAPDVLPGSKCLMDMETL